MLPTLPLLVVSLLAAAPPTAPKGKSPTNGERAKMGLLPRRVAPSRVTYLAEAARSRSERREFPEAGAPPTVVGGMGADAPAAEPVAASAPAVVDPGPAVVEAAPAPAAGAAIAVERGAVVSPPAELTPPPAAPPPAAPPPAIAVAPVAAAPAPVVAEAAVAAPAEGAPLAAVPAVARPRPSADEEPEPMAMTRPVTFLGERWVDRYGRIVVRVYGPRRVVLSERVTGTVDELPVRWAARTDHGYIVQIVEDPWGPIEVRRDPVGRFLAARTLASPAGR